MAKRGRVPGTLKSPPRSEAREIVLPEGVSAGYRTVMKDRLRQLEASVVTLEMLSDALRGIAVVHEQMVMVRRAGGECDWQKVADALEDAAVAARVIADGVCVSPEDAQRIQELPDLV